MNKKIVIWLALSALFLFLLWSGASFYPDWLWFKNLGVSPVFWTMVLSKLGLGAVDWLALMFIVVLNFFVAKRIKLQNTPEKQSKEADSTFPSPIPFRQELGCPLLRYLSDWQFYDCIERCEPVGNGSALFIPATFR